MYKANQDDIAYAKTIWQNQIQQMVYVPVDLKQAHKRLFGFDANTPQQARLRINSYFLYQYKASDETPSVPITTPSLVIDNPTHVEDLSVPVETDAETQPKPKRKRRSKK